MKNYDYSSNGLYFVTICTQGRVNLFGEIVGADSISAQGSISAQNVMMLNDAGKMIDLVYHEAINEYQNIILDNYVIMPNHFHAIIGISTVDNESKRGIDMESIRRADMESAPTLGTIIQTFKRYTTVKYIYGVKNDHYLPFNKRIWQRNYYEHIIRSKDEYEKIWDYIYTNPQKWADDRYYQ